MIHRYTDKTEKAMFKLFMECEEYADCELAIVLIPVANMIDRQLKKVGKKLIAPVLGVHNEEQQVLLRDHYESRGVKVFQFKEHDYTPKNVEALLHREDNR